MLFRKSVIFLAGCCLSAVLLSGCGGQTQEETTVGQTENMADYGEGDFIPIPDEGFISSSGMLETGSLERARNGNPAMYISEQGMDLDGDYYYQITEYTLDKKGNWERRDICPNSLTKRLIRKKSAWIYSIPYVIRGDDGELYALLQMDWYEQDGSDTDEDGTPTTQYSVLRLDEEKDALNEVSLRLEDSSLEGLVISPDTLTKFHVLEDGTLFFAFGKRAVVQFDGDTGTPVAVSENVPDDAFVQNVCYGEKEFIFYSTTDKMLQVLDLDTLTITKTFGEEIEESDRKKEWHFDSNTENWDMYGFNLSGLYAIKQMGKNASLQKISRDGVFDTLEDVTVFDILVDDEQNLYVLLRRQQQDTNAVNADWEFGVMKFSCTG